MTAFLVGWRLGAILPIGLIRGLSGFAGWWAWVTKSKARKRLEENIVRLAGLEGKALARASRLGFASTARYYSEVFELPKRSDEVINARVRMIGEQQAREAIDTKGVFVVVLSHSGNWDLVGSYTSKNFARVTSVAEVLKPAAVFEEFLKMRETLGMQILGHEGSSTFRSLIRIGKTEGGVLALVADRDLSGSGVVVPFGNSVAKVAPGPAALAMAVDCPLIPLAVRYERLTGERRKRAKSRWGIVMDFGPVVPVPAEGTNTEKVAIMTAEWAKYLSSKISETPEDWHMLQRFGWVD